MAGCRQQTGIQGGFDLMKYGIPVTLQAPADVAATQVGKGQVTDVAVKNDKGYDIQVFMTDAVSSDLKQLVQQKKEQAATNPYFVKIVEEYEDGFIFEKTSATEKSYDFYLIRIMGDKQVDFQCGNSVLFSEAQVKAMIKSVRP